MGDTGRFVYFLNILRFLFKLNEKILFKINKYLFSVGNERGLSGDCGIIFDYAHLQKGEAFSGLAGHHLHGY